MKTSHTMVAIGQAAKLVSYELARATTAVKDRALQDMADAIRNSVDQIVIANQKDMALAKQNGLSSASLDRLALDKTRIETMAKALDHIRGLRDPVGTVLATLKPPNQLTIQRISVPIGVIGVIYESRPNVTVDAAGLCLKSGNAVILRGGSDSIHSTMAIMDALQEGLAKSSLPASLLQMVPDQSRSTMDALLALDQYIDVIVPRGGPTLIEHVRLKSRVPIFQHLAGLCHTYVHQDADKNMAEKIVLNAKMRRTGICGATEVLLIDRAIVDSHLPFILQSLLEAGCQVRGNEQVVALDPRTTLVNDDDYDTEFLDAIIAIKIVDGPTQAIQHIQQHGSHHTDAIITNDARVAERFLQEVDSAIVMHNASTQFADGGEFGMGAEIGIATGKLHARGPVGLEQLTTFKYHVRGTGQIRQ